MQRPVELDTLGNGTHRAEPYPGYADQSQRAAEPVLALTVWNDIERATLSAGISNASLQLLRRRLQDVRSGAWRGNAPDVDSLLKGNSPEPTYDHSATIDALEKALDAFTALGSPEQALKKIRDIASSEREVASARAAYAVALDNAVAMGALTEDERAQGGEDASSAAQTRYHNARKGISLLFEALPRELQALSCDDLGLNHQAVPTTEQLITRRNQMVDVLGRVSLTSESLGHLRYVGDVVGHYDVFEHRTNLEVAAACAGLEAGYNKNDVVNPLKRLWSFTGLLAQCKAAYAKLTPEVITELTRVHADSLGKLERAHALCAAAVAVQRTRDEIASAERLLASDKARKPGV